jgi:hypothetical protein
MKRWGMLIVLLAIAAAIPIVLLLQTHRVAAPPVRRGLSELSASDGHQDSALPRLTKAEEDRLLLGDIAKLPSREIYALLAKRTAAEIARLTEELGTLPRSSASDAKIFLFYKAWATSDAEAALASAIALRTPHFRQQAIAGILRGADPGTAGLLARSINQLPANLLSADEKQNFLSSAVTRWSQADPITAAHFLDAIGATGLNFTGAFNSTATAWALQDPAAALAWAQQHPDGFGNLAMQGAINGWWQKDPAASEAYVATMPDASGRQELVVSFAGVLFRADPARAREWASQLPSVAARRAANNTIAQDWALDDPAAATQWAAQLPADERGSSTGGAARIWAREDPEAAGNFLNSLGGTVRDEAVASFSAIMAYENSSLALTWATTIADPKMRTDTEERIALEWMKQDPAGARAWIENSALPEAEKTRLLSTTPGL